MDLGAADFNINLDPLGSLQVRASITRAAAL